MGAGPLRVRGDQGIVPGAVFLDRGYSGTTIEGISAAIVHVGGGEDMKLKEATRPAEIVSELMGEEGLVIWGARVDRRYGSTLHVSIIMSGGSYSQGSTGPMFRIPQRPHEVQQPAEIRGSGADGDLDYLEDFMKDI
ncbi:MAG: hypothetical protein QXM81_07015 [Nitrososphaerota archaeon]